VQMHTNALSEAFALGSSRCPASRRGQNKAIAQRPTLCRALLRDHSRQPKHSERIRRAVAKRIVLRDNAGDALLEYRQQAED
jgi:hypothetical protein